MRKFRCEIIERGAHVVLFADAAIVLSLTLSDAAEIETEDRDVTEVQRFRGLVHDFIVHVAAEKRVRVADYGCERWIDNRGGPEQRLEASGGTCEEKVTMEDIGHEIASARV